MKKIVGVTKCPAGTAHTYMAAEKLKIVGEKLGYEVKIETQGSIGVENELTKEDIKDSIGVIIAADVEIEGIERFDGKKVLTSKTKEAINGAKSLFEKLENAPIFHAEKTDVQTSSEKTGVIKHIMNGVGYMIPFIAVFGILAVIANAFGGAKTETGFVVTDGTIWKVLFDTAKIGSTLMVPALGGYIAYSIAGRAALAPAMISSLMINSPAVLQVDFGLGFLGAILVGLMTGYITRYMTRLDLPRAIKGIMPTLIIPTVLVLFNTILFFYVLKYPVGFAFKWIMDSLEVLSHNPQGNILMGALIGGMIAFDMGGPVNKAAWMFAVAVFEKGNFSPLAAFAASAITAPLGLAIASVIAKKYFTKEERELLPNTIAMVCVGFSEGAIPYAANDPKTVIPSNVIGGMVAGAMAMFFGITDMIIKGGPIPALIGGINKPFLYMICILTGSLITTAFVILLKKLDQESKANKQLKSVLKL